MSNVIALEGCTPLGEADAEIVSELERLLESARSGYMRAFAYAVSNADKTIATGWVGSDGTRDPVGLAVSLLQHRYMQRMVDGYEA